MSPRVPKNVVALTPGGNITIEQVLGWLVMFSVPDKSVSLAKVLREFAKADLDTSFLPTKRVPVNVFQQACRSVETGRRAGGEREVKVDEIYEDTAKCVYQITLMIRDRDGEVIEHEKSMRVRFSKATSMIDVEALDPAAYKQLADLESAVRDHFDKHSSTLPGAKIRAALREYIRLLHGTNMMKRSGVYFVPKGGAKKETLPKDTLDTITEVLGKLYGPDASMWLVPFANADSERSMVETHFELNIEEVVTEQIGKLAGVLQRDPQYIRRDLLKNTIEQRRELGDLHARYKELLGDSLTGVQDKLKLYDEQIEALVEKADEINKVAA